MTGPQRDGSIPDDRVTSGSDRSGTAVGSTDASTDRPDGAGVEAKQGRTAHSTIAGRVRLVSVMTIVSRVLGLLRDTALAARFGNGPLLDAFTLAFRIPNLARGLLGEGALATAFLPSFVRMRHQRGLDAAAEFGTAVLISLAMLLAGVVVITEAVLLGLWSSGWLSPEGLLLTQLTAWLMPYVWLICLTALLAAMLQGLQEFFWPALIPILLNLVWIASLLWLVPWWSHPVDQLVVMSASLLLAGVLQLLLPLLPLRQLGCGLKLTWRQQWTSATALYRQLGPVLLGLSITQLNTLVDSVVAWSFAAPVLSVQDSPIEPPPAERRSGSIPGKNRSEAAAAGTAGSAADGIASPPSAEVVDEKRYPLTAGTASALYFGQRLYQFPLGVFGVALGTVLFPLFSQHAQAHDWAALRADLTYGLRLVAAIGLPASAGLMLLAHPLTRACFEYGQFDAADRQQTAEMIIAYGAGVWAYCGLLIVQRVFYALDDRWTPLKIGAGALVLNTVLNLTLIWPFGGVGLAASTAFVAAVQCLITTVLAHRRVGPLPWASVMQTVGKTSIATVVLSAVVLGGQSIWPFPDSGWERAVQVMGLAGLGVVSFLATAKLVGLTEPWDLLRRSPRRPPESTPAPEPAA
jgi:putative peptidoglycan lipid II flippase